LLVSALTNEGATGRIQAWLSMQDPAALLISEWVATEFSSALSMKLRTGQFLARDRAKAAGLFARLKAESLTVVPITRDHFLAAALLVDQYDIGLRAGDALHVAIAAALGATICTLDKRLADAAVAVGVNALLV
jgi:predicted nucleic acid-binding protein